MNQSISSIADRAKVLLVSNSPNEVRELLYGWTGITWAPGLAGDIDAGVKLAAGGIDLVLLDAALAGTLSAPPACACARRAGAMAYPCC